MSVLTKGERAANHWIIVLMVAQKVSEMFGPDGKKIEKNEAYFRVLDISPAVDQTKLGYAVGDLISGPRALWIPGLPEHVGMMSAGDVYYRMDEIPEGIPLVGKSATVDDFINPGLGGMLELLKDAKPGERIAVPPVDPEVHP